jgi:hypothetical protein
LNTVCFVQVLKIDACGLALSLGCEILPGYYACHHSPGLISSSILAGGEKIVEHFLYVKETVELVPEHPHRTHRVSPSSITSKTSVGTMVMFPSLEKSRTLYEPKLLGASYHPDEGVCQFGSQILVMSSSSEAFLDHGDATTSRTRGGGGSGGGGGGDGGKDEGGGDGKGEDEGGSGKRQWQ